MRSVNVGRKFLADYQSIILKDLLAEIKELAAPLEGRRVLHVNATSFGGGVAEILYTLLPLMNDVGLQAEWQVMTAEREFFDVTKSFHNGLQGAPVELTDEVRSVYEDTNRRNAEQLTPDYDFVVIHDPQPCAMRAFVADGGRETSWIWRCHISTPRRPIRRSTTTSCRSSAATTGRSIRWPATLPTDSACRSRSCLRRSTRWRPRT